MSPVSIVQKLASFPQMAGFRRSSRGAVLAGVCSGLSEAGYGPANFWRVVFVIFSFVWFIAPIAYIAIALLVPQAPAKSAPKQIAYGGSSSDQTPPAIPVAPERGEFADKALEPEVIELPAGASFIMKGVQDVLVVYKDRATITPQGVLGFLNKGVSGTKTIPFRSVAAIQFREAGVALSGFIQFTIPGGNERRGGVFSAANDENTFMFAGQQNNSQAVAIKEFIDKAIDDYHNSQRNQVSAAPSVSSELQQLAKLKSDGVLSEDEFLAAKKKLLNG